MCRPLVTVADVAQRTGLPYMTIWRHLHGRVTRLSPEERRRIDETLRELRQELMQRLLAEERGVRTKADVA